MTSDLFNCPIPLSIKLLYTFFVCVLVPAYWRQYGPANFLWFSDLALLIGLAALWLENPLLASMQTVSVVLLELLWSVEFFIGLITGKQILGLADYMFKSDKPLWLRGVVVSSSPADHSPLAGVLLWIRHARLDCPNQSILGSHAGVLFLHPTGREYQLGVRPREAAAKNTSLALFDIAADRGTDFHLSADTSSTARADAQIRLI